MSSKTKDVRGSLHLGERPRKVEPRRTDIGGCDLRATKRTETDLICAGFEEPDGAGGDIVFLNRSVQDILMMVSLTKDFLELSLHTQVTLT